MEAHLMAFLPPGGLRKPPPPVSQHDWTRKSNGLPASFLAQGFATADSIKKTRRLLIGTDGSSDTGKTEFAMSAPGPGIGICLDRGIDGALNNPNPPSSRRNDYAFKIISAPLPTQAIQRDYLEYWKTFYDWYKKALDNPDARTVIVDGDSDSWELQRLAEFGKITQVPAILYTNCNAARRAMYARAWDSGKVVIFTNKIKDLYIDETDTLGNPILGNDGKPKRKKSGEMVRQGFPDQDYLFHIQLRHHFKPAVNGKPSQYSVMITKCKSNAELIGTELSGPDCNMRSLLQLVYPEIPDGEWGF